jgi:type VI secretion system protein ImpK
MLAKNHTGSLLNQLAFTGSQILEGYYRSKLFIAPFTTNPLLAAASPLFSLIERLSVSNALPPVIHIRDNIEHELHAFYSRLNAANYSLELIAVARYLVCSTIDELIGKSYLRLNQEPVEFKAFTPLSHDGVEPQQRFFDVVSHIKERPNQHLDVIELAYFCLIAGFEGEQHFCANGRQTLDNLIDELYLLIQQHRVNKPHKLFHEPAAPATPRTTRIPTILILGFTFGLLGCAFFSSHLYLNSQAKSVLQMHSKHAFRED